MLGDPGAALVSGCDSSLAQAGIWGMKSSLLDSFTWPATPAGPFYTARIIAPKAQGENHTSAGIVVDADAGMMRLYDLRHDRKAETRSGGTRPLSTPEPFEHMVPLLWWDPGPTIRNAYAPVGVCADCNLGPRRGVCNGVLDQ